MLVSKSQLQSWYTDFKTTFNDKLNEIGKAESDWKLVAMNEKVTGDKGEYGWLGDPPKVSKWTGTRIIGGYNAGTYSLENEWWEDTIGIKLEDLTNEKAGMNRKKVGRLAYAFDADIEDQVWNALEDASDATSLCLDGVPLCDGSHPLDAGCTHFATGGTTQSNEEGSGAATFFLVDGRNPEKNGLPILFQYNTMPTFESLTTMDSDHVYKNREALFGSHASYAVGYGVWQTVYKGTSALSDTAFWAAYKAMLKFSDRKGRPARMKPSILVVGPTYVDLAYKMFDPTATVAPAGSYSYSLKSLGIKVLYSPYLA